MAIRQEKPWHWDRVHVEEMSSRTGIDRDVIERHLALEREIAAVDGIHQLRELFNTAIASGDALRRQRVLMRWIEVCAVSAEMWEVCDATMEHEAGSLAEHLALVNLATQYLRQ